MKHIKLFEQYINEAKGSEAPDNVKKVAQKFKAPVHKAYDIEHAFDIPIEGLQVMYINKDTGFGEPGWQIADEDGNEIYIGTSNSKAIDAIKKNM